MYTLTLWILAGLDTGDFLTASLNLAPNHYQGGLPQQGSQELQGGILVLEDGQGPSPQKKGPSQWENHNQVHLKSRLAQEQNQDHTEDILTPQQDPHVNLLKGIPILKLKHKQQNTLIFGHIPDLGVINIKTVGEQEKSARQSLI